MEVRRPVCLQGPWKREREKKAYSVWVMARWPKWLILLFSWGSVASITLIFQSPLVDTFGVPQLWVFYIIPTVHCVGQKLKPPFDAPPDKSPKCVHLVSRTAFIYSHASFSTWTEILPAGANMESRASKSYDISDLWTETVNTAG